MDAYATWTKIESVVTPFDELLGSSAEEGRAKLRKTPRRRKEPLMRRSPNGNPIASAILTFFCIGFLIAIAVAVSNIVFCILACVAASKGEKYRYPVSLRLIK